MYSKFFLSFFCLLFAFSCFCSAQEHELKNKIDSLNLQMANGKIQIIQDSRIDTLIKRHIELNESKPTIDGYRVQIHIASGAHSKKISNDSKAVFLSKYPDMDAYVIYQTPNFKVRVGDFRTKLEASKFLNEVKKDFPGAFIVKDEINLPKL